MQKQEGLQFQLGHKIKNSSLSNTQSKSMNEDFVSGLNTCKNNYVFYCYGITRNYKTYSASTARA